MNFEAGESIHTENSYKYRMGDAEALVAKAGFAHEATWMDERGMVRRLSGTRSLASVEPNGASYPLRR